MAMNYNDLKALALAAVKTEKNAPVAYSVSDGETYSNLEVNEALRNEINARSCDLYSFEENKNTIFRLISETIDEILPARVMQMYEQFAETRTVAQGDKAIFRIRITEASRRRAKTFITRAGLAGRYETFMLDGAELEVGTAAIGSAARLGFEEFLDGRWTLADFTEVVMESMDEYIYAEIAKALKNMTDNLQATNKATEAGFDEAVMDELLAIADSYGRSSIFCTQEFAAKMVPAEGWRSGDMKNALWNNGYLANYKGHAVVILPQSLVDETNTTKVVDPSWAYIIPSGQERPVKIAFEGATQIRTVSDNDDWSQDIQWYRKFGVAVFMTNYICAYQNTELTTATRS